MYAEKAIWLRVDKLGVILIFKTIASYAYAKLKANGVLIIAKCGIFSEISLKCAFRFCVLRLFYGNGGGVFVESAESSVESFIDSAKGAESCEFIAESSLDSTIFSAHKIFTQISKNASFLIIILPF